MALDESAPDQTIPPPSIISAVRGHLSFTRVQGVCGTLAALISIGGAFGYIVPHRTSDRGEVLAIVQEARSGKPVADATVELLTLQDALVTMVPPAAGAGTAKTPMKEGTYRLRVKHPKYTTESRQIYVLAGQTAQIKVRLSPRPLTPPAAPTGTPVAATEPPSGTPYDSIKKIFR